MFRRFAAAALAGALAFAMPAIPAVPAAADGVDLDGDLVSPGIQNVITRSAEPGETVTASARLQIDYSGQNHVPANTTVTFTPDATWYRVNANGSRTQLVSLPLGLALGGGSVKTPSPWSALTSPAVAAQPSSISFLAPAVVGDYQLVVKWSVASPSLGNNVLTGTRALVLDLAVANAAPPPDTAPPIVTISAAGTEATGASTPLVFSASASDAVDGSITPTCTPASGSGFTVGTHTITCAATDAAGNRGEASAQVTITDTTPPTITLPASLEAEAADGGGVTVTYGAASATDTVDGAVTPTCSPASGSRFALGVTLVTCTAIDAHDNRSDASFAVRVQDTTAPVLSVPGDATVEATGAAGAAHDYSASATDTVDGPVGVSCDPPSGTLFGFGPTTVSCTATDSAGNGAGGSFTVTVQDTTAPVLVLPAPITEATGSAGAVVEYVASAHDAVSGAVTPSCSPASGATFPVGASTVTCSAADLSGNSRTESFAVHVVDTTPPVLSLPAPVEEATGPAGAVVSYSATATDLVDGGVTVSCDRPSGSTFAVGTSPVMCSAADAAGNQSTGWFPVVVRDTRAPDLDLPAPIVEATGPGGAAVSFTATATDVVSGAVAVLCTATSGQTFPLGDTTVTCSATDGSANTATDSFTVTVRDTTAPTLTLPVSAGAEATGPGGAVVSYDTSAADVVSGALAVGCSNPSGSVFGLGVTVVHCTATDAAGNTGSGSFPVTIVDTTAPTLDLPASAGGEATGPDGAVVVFSTSASDTVSGSLPVTCTTPAGSTFPLGDTPVTCAAADAAGNPVSGGFVVTVSDTTAPALSLPAEASAEATGPSGATVTYTSSASDIVDGPVPVACSAPSGSTFPLGDTVVSCSATDARGNVAPGSFRITVRDTTGPVLVVPTEVLAEATGPDGAPVTFTTSATDIVDGTVPVTCDPTSGSTFALGDRQVGCAATDAAGNRSTAAFNVNVGDTTAPQLALPAPITAEATGPDGAAVTYTTSATDIVSGNLPVDCSAPSGGTFPLGSTSVSCSAADAAGNLTGGTFTVTVADTTAPSVSVPSSIGAEATSAVGAVVDFTAGASDAVTADLHVHCAPASGSTFPLGTTGVTCTTTDAAGNVGSGAFTITVSDTVAPTLTLPASATEEATGPGGASVSYPASAADAVSADLLVACTPTSGSTFAVGETTVHCSATDDAGNAGYGSFGVTVTDTTAPVLQLPAPITAEAVGPGGAIVGYTATASDIVSGALTPDCTPASWSAFPLGTTTVDCTATDAAGNPGTGSFTVTVVDTTAPTLSLPASAGGEATGPSGAAVGYTATASDVVDGGVTPSCSPESGSTFALGATTVDCTATDAAGNTGSGSFTVTVVDTTPPSLSLPAPITVPATGFGGTAVTYTATAADIVSGPVVTTCTPTSGATFPIGSTTVGCTATDGAGLTSSGSFTVRVGITTRGYFSPVDMAPAVNTVKAGSTVPLKFNVPVAGGYITDVGIVASFKQVRVTCATGAVEDAIEIVSTGGTSLRYDLTGNQFIQNWKTPLAPGACYSATVTFLGGSQLTASFKLK